MKRLYEIILFKIVKGKEEQGQIDNENGVKQRKEIMMSIKPKLTISLIFIMNILVGRH